MSRTKRFVLIDANSIIHRAYHAYPAQLTTSSGEQTNAVYGFSSLLLKVVEDLEPDYLVCAFDVPKPTVRHKKYEEYKSHRKPYDKELLDQIPKCKEVLTAFDIPIFEKEGYEADDVIGTIEDEKRILSLEKIIVTSDQDLLQLVDKDTKVYLSGKNFKDSKLCGTREVVEKLGISPNQLTDYKALFGDSSDNIPGVKGIGKNGALSLILKYKSLDAIYRDVNKIEVRYQKKLKEGKENAFMSKELATIIKDVPISINLSQCKWGELDGEKVKYIFRRFEFHSLVRRLDQLKKVSPRLVKTEDMQNSSTGEKFEIINDMRGLEVFVKELEKQKAFAITYQGSGGNCIDKYPENLAFSWGDIAFLLNVNLLKSGDGFTPEGVKVKRILENRKIFKTGHDLKSTLHASRNFGVEMQGLNFDIKVAAYLLQKGGGGTGLGELAFNYLGEVFDRQDQQSLVGLVDSSNSLDKEARLIWKLYKKLSSNFKKSTKTTKWDLEKLSRKIEMPLVRVLARMECNGILIDKKYLTQFSKKLDNDIRKSCEKAYKCIGHEFNISSPKQVSELLFEELDLPKSRRGKSGQHSTGIRVLEGLKGVHPVIDCILKYRELAKLRSTYTTSLLDSVNEKTGRIHSNFNQTVTATGRLSSTEPNLQNIPISSDLGREVRKAFVVEKGAQLVSFDYSQQELRILAHLANERNLIEAFEKGTDVHALTASKVFDKDIKAVTKKERQIGKTINFGVMYGMSPHGLSSLLAIEFDEAARFIEKYFEEYSAVRDFFENYLKEAQKRGFAVTIFGRQRSASGLNLTNVAAHNAAIREIINFPIQGSAADMMKLAMVKVDELVQKEFEDKAKMVLQIHDELVFEFKGTKRLKEFKSKVEKFMEEVYDLKVPLKVDVYTGSNLEEVH